MNMADLKAVIPVAGLSMHMLPATKANSKEMLPIVDKPMIQYMFNRRRRDQRDCSGDALLLEERGGKPLRPPPTAGSLLQVAR